MAESAKLMVTVTPGVAPVGAAVPAWVQEDGARLALIQMRILALDWRDGDFLTIKY